jgi:hypothetical protein
MLAPDLVHIRKQSMMWLAAMQRVCSHIFLLLQSKIFVCVQNIQILLYNVTVWLGQINVLDLVEKPTPSTPSLGEGCMQCTLHSPFCETFSLQFNEKTV